MDLASLLIGIAVLPFQAVHFAITSVLNVIFFDILQLGAGLPVGM